MEISLRLKTIAEMIDKCDSIADIGTDHGYIPIYLIKMEKIKRAIASDINKGPVNKAKFNSSYEGLDDKIDCRLGGGFSTIKPNEVDSAVIAGMGGNLIRDIISEGMKVFKTLDYVILQPVQNPEVLRKYIYDMGFNIIDEELCLDEGIYYEILKVSYGSNKREVNPIYYEIGEKLIEKKHPLLLDFIKYNIDKYTRINSYITDTSENSLNRKRELEEKIKKLEEVASCL